MIPALPLRAGARWTMPVFLQPANHAYAGAIDESLKLTGPHIVATAAWPHGTWHGRWLSSNRVGSHMATPSESTHPNRAAFPAGLSGPALRPDGGAARALGSEFFGCEHVMLALLRDDTGLVPSMDTTVSIMVR